MTSMKQIDGYKIYMNQKIGQGSFGAVYTGVSDATGEKVAVKILTKSSIDADQYLKNALFSQIKIMESIKSQNIVGFYDVMQSNKNYYIVQELCDGGDLNGMLKGGNKIPEKQAIEYLLQIANGFLALVREGIIHRDIKPANLMLRNKKIKIGDFGFAKKTETASKISNQTIVGTPLYMSLQILKSQPYSSKCDIWAIGFIFYEMLHGYPPWNGKSQFDLVNKIQSKPLEIKDNLSKQTKDFLKRSLQLTQQKRISWDQLFVHPIFNGYFSSKGNQQFQNKLKMIMSDIRFQINSQNLDICKILAGLGYNNGKSQLDKERFFKFLRIISPDISKEASDYIFLKTDFDKNGTISINQIQKILSQNNITMTKLNTKLPAFQRIESQSFTKISPQIENKIKTLFAKLMNQIVMSNSTLREIFQKFDNQKKGRLSYADFYKMMKNVNKDIKDDEIEAAFGLIDEDGSKTIEFKELDNYYNKVNGVPMSIKKNSSNQNKMDEQVPTQKNNGMNNNMNNNMNNGMNMNNMYQNQYGGMQMGMQGGYPMYPNSFNPFNALINPNYMPPPMYNPNPFYYPPPPPQNFNTNNNNNGNGGMFDNFVFNQLQSASKKASW